MHVQRRYRLTAFNLGLLIALPSYTWIVAGPVLGIVVCLGCMISGTVSTIVMTDGT